MIQYTHHLPHRTAFAALMTTLALATPAAAFPASQCDTLSWGDGVPANTQPTHALSLLAEPGNLGGETLCEVIVTNAGEYVIIPTETVPAAGSASQITYSANSVIFESSSPGGDSFIVARCDRNRADGPDWLDAEGFFCFGDFFIGSGAGEYRAFTADGRQHATDFIAPIDTASVLQREPATAAFFAQQAPGNRTVTLSIPDAGIEFPLSHYGTGTLYTLANYIDQETLNSTALERPSPLVLEVSVFGILSADDPANATGSTQITQMETSTTSPAGDAMFALRALTTVVEAVLRHRGQL